MQRRWPKACVTSFLLCTAMHGAPAHAQDVTGLLRARESGEPVGGAVVHLVDPSGAVVAYVLSDPSGRYHLRAPRAGTYHIRIERIGLATESSGAIELTAERLSIHDVMLGFEPVSLEGIEVRGAPRCALPGGTGDEVQVLWTEARKTLHAVALLDGTRLAAFRFVLWDRELDPDGSTVLWERRRPGQVLQADPFFSLPPEDLLREGFVRSDGDSTVYHVPDAKVLLSDAFLQAYCFRAVEGRGDEVGLAFWPVDRARHWNWAEGTLWLDRGSAALDRLEFGYTNVPSAEPPVATGGTLWFSQLENGAWVVARWELRMPRVAMVGGSPTGEVVRVRERGGQVLESSLGTGTASRRVTWEGATLSGSLLRADQPLRDALVYLSGTDRADTTDSEGAFRLDGIPPGHYVVGWFHAGDVAAARVWPTQVRMAERDTSIVLREGRAERDPEELCRGGDEAPESGAVVGIARTGSGIPLAHVSVRLSDPDGSLREARTDAVGRFHFCGVRSGSRVTLREEGGVVSRHVVLRSRDLAVMDLRPSPDATGVVFGRKVTAASAAAEGEAAPASFVAGRPSRIVGRVVNAVDRRPVEAAVVEIVGTDARALTDESGRFILADVEPRLLTVRATFIGSEPAEDTVRVRPGEFVQLTLSVGPVALDPIVVTARRAGALADVHWRASTHSFGTFISAQELETKSPRWVGDALFDVPGVQVSPQGTGRTGQITLRGRCAPMVYLDGLPLTHLSNRQSAQAMGEAYDAVNLIHPSSVEIIEVYRGPSELPAVFGGSTGQCGAIAIWTKRGT